jgi:hypothetical protein
LFSVVVVEIIKQKVRLHFRYRRVRPLPRHIIIARRECNESNGLLTPTGKLCRRMLRQTFLDTKTIDDCDDDKDDNDSDDDNDAMSDWFKSMIGRCLPPKTVVDARSTFVELGGDSVGATMLRTALQRKINRLIGNLLCFLLFLYRWRIIMCTET